FSRTVRAMRREKGHRLVAPVVQAAWGSVLGIELKNRQQLHGGNAQGLEVWDLFHQSGVSAALCRRDARAGMAREAADVKLVDNGLDERALERRGPRPIV